MDKAVKIDKTTEKAASKTIEKGTKQQATQSKSSGNQGNKNLVKEKQKLLDIKPPTLKKRTSEQLKIRRQA